MSAEGEKKLKVLKKVLSSLLFVLAGMSAWCFDASESWTVKKDKLIEAVNNTNPVYYNDYTGQLKKVYIENDYFGEVELEVDYENLTIKGNGCATRKWMTEIGINDILKNCIRLKQGKVAAAYTFFYGVPLPDGITTDSQKAEFSRNIILKNFDRCLGTFEDEETGRLYTLERHGYKYKITIKFPNERINQLVDILKIEDGQFLRGERVTVYFQNYERASGFSIYDPYPTKRDMEGYAELDGLEIDSDDEPIHNVYFYAAPYIYIDEDGTQNIVDMKTVFSRRLYPINDNEEKIVYINTLHASIGKLEDEGKNKILKSVETFKSFKTYEDENGWRTLESGDKKFKFVDGSSYGFAFSNPLEFVKNQEEFNECLNSRQIKANGSEISNISASSTLTDKYHTYYPESTLNVLVTDGKPLWLKNNIPWVEGKSGDGIGEFIEFDVKIPQNCIYSYIGIIGGYVNPLKPHLFKQNNRLRKVLVETDAGYSWNHYFEDAVKIQYISIPSESKHVKITIKEVYKGSRYDDTCITAIMFKEDRELYHW